MATHRIAMWEPNGRFEKTKSTLQSIENGGCDNGGLAEIMVP